MQDKVKTYANCLSSEIARTKLENVFLKTFRKYLSTSSSARAAMRPASASGTGLSSKVNVRRPYSPLGTGGLESGDKGLESPKYRLRILGSGRRRQSD